MQSPSMHAFRPIVTAGLALALLTLASPAAAQWVEFANETSTRLSALAGDGTNDTWEKDYAWGDVDLDGDIDLVVVRKQPFTSPGKAPNVLFLNENGVLVDRTATHAALADVPGDMGFLTPTNDRDVILVDVDNDGWLDIVTAVTISDGDPKHIGHPRVYMNLRNDGSDNWLGFRFEDARVTAMLSYSGQAGFNPRFCSVAAGDVNGDGYKDLWFGDYDSSGDGGFEQPEGADYNDRLLLNQGNGLFFKDFTRTSLQGLINIPGAGNERFEVSAFGAAANIDDMNGDGFKDIIKQTSLNDPLYVGIAYNDPADEGFFDSYDVVNQLAPYFVSIGDLNNDDKLDMVITDDNADRFLLNQGNDANGQANFLSRTFSFDAYSDDGFGSNSVIADLDNDGFEDVLIADVDVDITGCNRRMHIYRNLGGAPGSQVTLQEQTEGTCNPPSLSGCSAAGIPLTMLRGVHDVAVFDIDEDGWKDLVIGRCGTTEVWMNQPPVGLAFNYPQGLPGYVEPQTPYTFQIQVQGFGASQPEPGTGQLWVSVGGGPFQQMAANHLGGNLYEVALPAADCPETISFYFTAEDQNGGTFTDPSSAPADSYTAIVALGLNTVFEDHVEGDVSGWSVVNDGTLTSGAWEAAVPNGTISSGQIAAPNEDGDGSQDQTRAFVTQNGPPGGETFADDVDGGPTDLISPVIDLAGADATINYKRWFFDANVGDALTVWVTNDGTNWVLAETVTNPANTWTASSFKVGDYVTPSSTVQVRFRANDVAPSSIVEAGMDAFRVDKLICNAADVPAGSLDFSGSTPLIVTRTGVGDDVTLTWGESCLVEDTDYEVYEGQIGIYPSHASRLCSTGGATNATLTPNGEATYYLVVPTNSGAEGSYGLTSDGLERPQGSPACAPQNVAACD